MFFDGTNNNKKRDQEDIPDPARRSHSNVVVLHDAFREDPKQSFPYYMPGVGTAFPKIGEMTESSAGKSMAVGGEARLHWAMIQLYNAIHLAINQVNLVEDDEAQSHIRNPDTLKNIWTPASGKRRSFFESLERRLTRAIAGRRPEITQINLSVFGFSRGAAEARTFCNWVLECCRKRDSAYTFCGIPIRFQFLGLFDTVASVGLADSSPVGGDGLMDWADGTMAVPSAVERCVHFVAAHEIRKSFPLSSVRCGSSYPSNCVEIVYPGAHSDVGGGYAPGEQGKSIGARSRLASQIPLWNMYSEARKAGVPLMENAELEKKTLKDVIGDLRIDPDLAHRFRDYANWSRLRAQRVEDILFQHMRFYWRWRLKSAPHFNELGSVGRATPQDREDLHASERDFQMDMRRAMLLKRRHETAWNRSAVVPVQLPSIVVAATEEQKFAEQVPPSVCTFFDDYIHDSHASFYLAGPLSAYEKSEKLKRVKEKQMQGQGKALTSFERRMLEADGRRAGDFPVMTDADFENLLDLESLANEVVVKMMTGTRREGGGHVRRRVVFDGK